jgi:hypothetical protein
MMFIRQIISFCFSLLVVISTTSFSLSIHFCGNAVADIGVFEKQVTCAMQAQVPPCHKQTKPDCCHDAVVSYDAQEYTTQNVLAYNPTIDVEVVQYACIIRHQLYASEYDLEKDHEHDDPPLPKSDRQILLQVFII